MWRKHNSTCRGAIRIPHLRHCSVAARRLMLDQISEVVLNDGEVEGQHMVLLVALCGRGREEGSVQN
eukprot:CAMPEP_0206517968 /NCGR_PEP_ID=MMETSP0324_2-20121206/64308_1 /ASSEMBLY_ACC=CAM_ASM_000836 /TAXON_ID=2866 /ORGANISM="Crypthecodinium cohnii, Strain Seligo" /LENGTH=66 /DNA_ID=CAMNT_0054011253 /DNA_START=1396 /DNA_END=1596 /DNA_ORIENTATION=+